MQYNSLFLFADVLLSCSSIPFHSIPFTQSNFLFACFLISCTLHFQLLVPRPHLSFEAQLVAGKSHEFGPINCPDQPTQPLTISTISYGKQNHEAELRYPQRIRRLNIFPASKTEVFCNLRC